MLISKAKQGRCKECYAEHAAAKPNPYASSSPWRRLSRRKREEQPWCSRCATQGSPSNPLTLDHLVPLAIGGALVPEDEDDVQVLCKRCQGVMGGTAHAPGPYRA
jgi:hypothetical protein